MPVGTENLPENDVVAEILGLPVGMENLPENDVGINQHNVQEKITLLRLEHIKNAFEKQMLNIRVQQLLNDFKKKHLDMQLDQLMNNGFEENPEIKIIT